VAGWSQHLIAWLRSQAFESGGSGGESPLEEVTYEWLYSDLPGSVYEADVTLRAADGSPVLVLAAAAWRTEKFWSEAMYPYYPDDQELTFTLGTAAAPAGVISALPVGYSSSAGYGTGGLVALGPAEDLVAHIELDTLVLTLDQLDHGRAIIRALIWPLE